MRTHREHYSIAQCIGIMQYRTEQTRLPARQTIDRRRHRLIRPLIHQHTPRRQLSPPRVAWFNFGWTVVYSRRLRDTLNGTLRHQDLISRSLSGHRRRLINIGRATRLQACVTPSCLRSSPGVGISGACGPPLVWRVRKPLPSALRSSAALALRLARQRAPVPEHVLWSRVSGCAPNGCVSRVLTHPSPLA